ncbi:MULTISPECIES: ABC transporter substrate-binding protein [Bradyrhizobium]|uniref:ABC transporter substrate-binding protein n=1 Tax=Bradyrhizobium TaxID=374 RepID=UPI0003F96A30|nr:MULTISPECIES: ABC transporter substrate-binding protein [Bradyrhizobium]WLB89786.1 ABC transporter substrate-binding protein [Bradyrhizobium japonicum USDA 135]GLR94323.1 ABC transporter substrate-binding protein [Bradyrhizobium liaoningense]
MKKKALVAALAALSVFGSARAEIAKGTVKIGVLTDMSGPYADNVGAGSVLAAQMAVEDFGGKAGGTPVEIVSADHQNKADVGLGVARRWYDTEGVDAITEVVSSGVALAVQQLTREKDKVFLATGPGTPDLTGKACSPNGVHWAYDNYALANVATAPLVKKGLKSWFFLTADYSFGQALEAEASKVVLANGGTVLGAARAPLNTPDFSSFLLQAQASKSQVVGLANAGADMMNSLKQANEFGLTAGGQSIAALLVNLPDIHGLGLANAKGLIFADSFYWDANDKTREWSKRFMARFKGKAPGSLQIAVYGAVTHYLKAIEAKKSESGSALVAEMKKLPINDVYTTNASIREDGRVIRDMYLLQVKDPSESKYPWDYYKILATVPGDQAFRPLKDGNCPLVGAAK